MWSIPGTELLEILRKIIKREIRLKCQNKIQLTVKKINGDEN